MKKLLLLKTLLFLCALLVGTSAWANSNVSTVSTKFDAEGTVTSKFTQTGDFTSAAWNLAVTWKNSTSWQNLDGTKGAQIGSGSAPATSIVLTGSSIPGTITSVVVNTSGAKDIDATVAVSVGGTGFTCGGNATASLTSSAANYTFTGSGTGNVVVTWTNSSDKAIYVKSITTTYSTGGASDPSISLSSSSINATEGGENGTINVTYNNIASVDSEVKFYESNGTTPADYDWLTATINNTDNTKLDYTINANTGAARTAYMKVHEKNSDVYSGLISITQAAKSVAAPTVNLTGSTYFQGTELTLTSAGNTVYYNLTTNGSEPATPNSTTSTEYTDPIALGSGTTKIKAIAYDTYGNKSTVTTRTYTGVAVATLPFIWDKKETSTTGVISSGVGIYNTSPYLQFDGTNDYLILKFDGTPVKLSFDIKGNSFSGGTFKVQTSADGETYTDLKSYTELGTKQTETFTNELASSVRYIKWIYTNKSSGNVALGNINVIPPTIDVTIGSSKYAAYCSPCALDFSTTDVKAYKAAVSDGKVTLTKVDVVPANEGVILYCETPDTYTINVTDKTASDVTGNELIGVTERTLVEWETGGDGKKNYILQSGVFKKATTGGYLKANRAYLHTSYVVPATARDYLEFSFEDDVTGISDATRLNDNEKLINDNCFDLQGRKVTQPTKGLYIVNGKKVIIK